MAAPIVPEEPIARCLVQSNHYKPAAARVTERAFLPGPDGTTSVFRVLGLTPAEIWTLADRYVGQPSGRPVIGTGTLAARVVGEVGLVLEADDEPPRHAAISGWPEEKDARKSQAQLLAAAAALVVRPQQQEQ